MQCNDSRYHAKVSTPGIIKQWIINTGTVIEEVDEAITTLAMKLVISSEFIFSFCPLEEKWSCLEGFLTNATGHQGRNKIGDDVFNFEFFFMAEYQKNLTHDQHARPIRFSVASILLTIGEGKEPVDEYSQIELPEELLIPYENKHVFLKMFNVLVVLFHHLLHNYFM